MAPLNDALFCLSARTHQLNQSTEELNGKIEALEKTLAEMHLGISVWLGLCISERHEQEDAAKGKVIEKLIRQGYDLGYQKLGSSWKIAVKRVGTVSELAEPGDYEEVDRTDLSDPYALMGASREVRAIAARYFEELVSELTKQVEYVRRRVTMSNDLLDEYLSQENAENFAENQAKRLS